MKRLMQRLSLASLLFPLGCGLGLLDDLQDVPVCDGQATDPECVDLHPGSTSSGSSGGVTPTTAGADEGILTTTVTAATLPDLTTGTSSDPSSDPSGEPPAAAPMIVDVEILPNMLSEAATIAVQVQALDAAEVTMALDGAEPISLTKSGADIFDGTIEVYGSSMNGDHTVMIEASNAGLVDTQPAFFDVDTPPAGQEVWSKTHDPVSQTRAIAVDLEGNVYETGTTGEGASARTFVSKRGPDGKIAWPGKWLTYDDTKSRGEDIVVGPDGMIHVLSNFEDEYQHTRWRLLKLHPDVGVLVDDEIGESDEPARGLSIGPNGNRAIVGYVTVSSKDNPVDIQTKVWFKPSVGLGVNTQWGYSPGGLKNQFTEMPEDILIAGQRILVTGSVEGFHVDAMDMVLRKRLFVFELKLNGELIDEHVVVNDIYTRSGGYALAPDGKGGVVTAGWACNDICTQVGDIRWFDGDLEPNGRRFENGMDGPAYAFDIAYSPAGYNVVALATSLGAGFNLGLHVTGYRVADQELVLNYAIDTNAIEMGQAVGVGLHGDVWFGGLRMMDNTFRAVAGRLHGY